MTAEETMDAQAILSHYKRLQAECQQLAGKTNQFELELSEHNQVIEQLKPHEPTRKAFRLIGSVLAERTVGDVLPVVEANAAQLASLIKQVEEALQAKERETRAWRDKYKIRQQSVKEVQEQQQRLQQQLRREKDTE